MIGDRSVEKIPSQDHCSECSQRQTCDAFSVADCTYLTEALDAGEKSALRQKLNEYRQNYMKYKLLCNTAPDAIFVADAETGIILEANQKAAELLGIPVDEIIGMHQTQLHPPEDAQQYAENFRRHLQTKGTMPIEEDVYILRKDGHKIPVQIAASVTQIGNRKIVCGIFRDVRHTKQLLKDLQNSKERFRRLSDASFEAILVHKDGAIIDANKRFIEMHGFSFEELKKIVLIELIAPEFRTTVLEHHASNYTKPAEVVGLRKDGSRFPLEIRGRASIIEGCDAMITVSRDLTEQKQIQSNLKDSQKRFQQLANATFEGIMIHQGETILEVNQQFADLFGYTIDEMKGMNGLKLAAPVDLEQVKQLARKKELDPENFDFFEVRGLCKDGSTIYLEVRRRHLTWKGQPAYVSVMRNITEQKNLLRQLEKSEAKYRELYEHAHVALFRTTLDGTLLDCNKACLRFFGYSEYEDEVNYLNKVRVTDYYVNPNQREDFLEALKKYKHVKGFEVELRRNSGVTFFAAISAELFAEREYIEGAMYDITAKKILTRAEKNILASLLEGKSNKQIARELGRSVRTIEDHRAHIMKKFDVDNAFELTQKAHQMGFEKIK